jgi:hypothetical protein
MEHIKYKTVLVTVAVEPLSSRIAPVYHDINLSIFNCIL